MTDKEKSKFQPWFQETEPKSCDGEIRWKKSKKVKSYLNLERQILNTFLKVPKTKQKSCGGEIHFQETARIPLPTLS